MIDIQTHISEVLTCRRCPNMIGPVVTHHPVLAKVYLAGQAPGPREGQFGKPFAWTAGKTLFRWLESIGVDEETFRALTFIGAVCRCFPGKAKGGGDRVPSPEEVQACAGWMEREIHLMQPDLIIPVGRLAIEQFLPAGPLKDVIGKLHRVTKFGHTADVIALPHPSGASTWFKMEPGKSLLEVALKLIEIHPAWQPLKAAAASSRKTVPQ